MLQCFSRWERALCKGDGGVINQCQAGRQSIVVVCSVVSPGGVGGPGLAIPVPSLSLPAIEILFGAAPLAPAADKIFSTVHTLSVFPMKIINLSPASPSEPLQSPQPIFSLCRTQLVVYLQGAHTQTGDESSCGLISPGEEGILTCICPWCGHRKGPVFYWIFILMCGTEWIWAGWRKEKRVVWVLCLQPPHSSITITWENSLGRWNSLILTAKSSMPLQWSCSLTVVCSELHHLPLTNTTSPPFFLLPLSLVMSAQWRSALLTHQSYQKELPHIP